MDHVNYLKHLFESITQYRKNILLIFLFKNDNDLLTECEFLKNDVNLLRKEFENTLLEQNEEYLAYIKDQDESINEKVIKK